MDDRFFTVRWMASQFQVNHYETMGYWSWMNGTLQPPVTHHGGVNQVETQLDRWKGRGWTYPEAKFQEGGTVFMRE